MAALRRLLRAGPSILSPTARFGRYVARFCSVFPGWEATEASGCKILASQALEEAAPLFPILMDNRYRLHLL